MNKREYLLGLALGSLAFIIWGLLPLYWKLVSILNPYQVFSHRVIWSLLFVLIILKLKGQFKAFIKLVKQPRNWLKMTASAFFISVNWLMYIWSVNNGYVIETSLGYYINPLVLTLFGMIFLKESLTNLQKIGIFFATIGVAYKTWHYGSVPIIALIIAISFAIYGLLKKTSKMTSLNGLAFETAIISLPTAVFLVKCEATNTGITNNLPVYFWLLIALSGIATAIPLILYAESSKRLPLNVLGFLQYLAPTISLFLGVFIFSESFTLNDLIAFSLIWMGLMFFSVSQYLSLKNT